LRELPEAAAVAQPLYLAVEDQVVRTRLVAIRKSEAATESARRKILHESRRKGKEPDSRTLEAAAYVFVLTTLPPSVSASQALEVYRARWPIAIAIKRLKSVLQFDALRARDPALAQAYLHGKLLAYLLVDDLTRRAKAFPPGDIRSARSPHVNTWRAHAVWQPSLEVAICGPALFRRLTDHLHRLGPRLWDPPRRRSVQAERAVDLQRELTNLLS
jgi:hypothetical protein